MNMEEEHEELNRTRRELLEQVEEWMEMPMLVLGFVWLVLLVVEFTAGLSPIWQQVVTAIWITFIFEFALRFVLADRRLRYLRSNWLTAIALLLPALRMLRVVRVLRVARAARGLRLVRVLSSLNRGMRNLRTSMSRRGFGYVITLTAIVVLVGAAGMYTLEPELRNYGEALWWTSMLITSLGSDFWPQTPEGRLLTLVLAAYGFAVFGYLTAAFAAFFIGSDARATVATAGAAESINALHAQIQALRRQLPPAPEGSE
ncbi:ion transporter [Ectothiorhodospiraceae bacterium 2226]|nr:ion transporter [Ectothiorhodospiraceae bacterium 2226]